MESWKWDRLTPHPLIVVTGIRNFLLMKGFWWWHCLCHTDRQALISPDSVSTLCNGQSVLGILCIITSLLPVTEMFCPGSTPVCFLCWNYLALSYAHFKYVCVLPQGTISQEFENLGFTISHDCISALQEEGQLGRGERENRTFMFWVKVVGMEGGGEH